MLSLDEYQSCPSLSSPLVEDIKICHDNSSPAFCRVVIRVRRQWRPGARLAAPTTLSSPGCRVCSENL